MYTGCYPMLRYITCEVNDVNCLMLVHKECRIGCFFCLELENMMHHLPEKRNPELIFGC